MATIRWCPIFPKWDIYQPLLLLLKILGLCPSTPLLHFAPFHFAPFVHRRTFGSPAASWPAQSQWRACSSPRQWHGESLNAFLGCAVTSKSDRQGGVHRLCRHVSIHSSYLQSSCLRVLSKSVHASTEIWESSGDWWSGYSCVWFHSWASLSLHAPSLFVRHDSNSFFWPRCVMDSSITLSAVEMASYLSSMSRPSNLIN